MRNKGALCNRSCNLKSRLKVFDAIVTPTILYGASTWTMKADMEQRLRTTRRRMLRHIVGVRRKPDETWVEYIQRATHRSEDIAKQSNLTDWNELQRRRKWQYAGKVARFPKERWCHRILEWRPWFRCSSKRDVGRPSLRWSDDLVAMAGGDWHQVAANVHTWDCLEEGYVQRAF